MPLSAREEGAGGAHGAPGRRRPDGRCAVTAGGRLRPEAGLQAQGCTGRRSPWAAGGTVWPPEGCPCRVGKGPRFPSLPAPVSEDVRPWLAPWVWERSPRRGEPVMLAVMRASGMWGGPPAWRARGPPANGARALPCPSSSKVPPFCRSPGPGTHSGKEMWHGCLGTGSGPLARGSAARVRGACRRWWRLHGQACPGVSARSFPLWAAGPALWRGTRRLRGR